MRGRLIEELKAYLNEFTSYADELLGCKCDTETGVFLKKLKLDCRRYSLQCVPVPQDSASKEEDEEYKRIIEVETSKIASEYRQVFEAA